MENISYLQDAAFLRNLMLENLRTVYVKITVLNKQELPIRAIEGRVSSGSINIDGSSSMRRTANLTFVAEEVKNDLHDIDNLLAPNKRISISIGVKNTIDDRYDDIVWFKQGIFIIINPSISHSISGVTINLTCKDKMCLLNGECGGTLPASITFHEFDEIQTDGSIISRPQLIYDIIQTLVMNYGQEPLNKIFINDVALEIKQIVHYTGSTPLYYNTSTHMYTLNEKIVNSEAWKVFTHNDEVGYIYTDFTYPGELVSGIGESITSVLDKIISILGNYEYYYDVEGNFIFQEKRNYLNNAYQAPVIADDTGKILNGSILNGGNYKVDFSSSSKTVFDFDVETGLISSFSNAPSYTNLKNDYHIWGQNKDDQVIHYHLAIKSKPAFFIKRNVVFLKDDKGEFTGRLRLAAAGDSDVKEYTPKDWRAELYLQGLEKIARQERPDIYEQELLDLFDTIYDFQKGNFKTDIVNKPNNLCYFLDYLEPVNELFTCSVDAIDSKVYTYQQDKICKLYSSDIPNVILVKLDEDVDIRSNIIERCNREGQNYSNIDSVIYSNLNLGAIGYSAQETVRNFLYQYTNYNETISLQSIPIYFLEPNTRISVRDMSSKIYGDYIIKSISIPLDGKTVMSVSATRALERV